MILQSRRSFLQAAAATGLTSPMLSGCASTEPGPFFEANEIPIGIQLYTLGPDLLSDPEGALQRLAEIGYQTVEIPSYLGQTPGALRASFDAAGLSCTSAHVGMRPGTNREPGLLGDLDVLSEHMHTIGATYVIAPILAPPPDVTVAAEEGEGVRVIARIAAAMSADHWKRLAEQLNTIGQHLQRNGLSFGYHNHNIEFAPVGDQTGWDIMVAETDPDLVTFELDVGWVGAAGVDPAEIFARAPGRYRLMHVKDLKSSTTPNLNLRMDPTEVGSGSIDWPSLLKAAQAAGVSQYFVEQEAPFERNRLDAAAISFNYLNGLSA